MISAEYKSIADTRDHLSEVVDRIERQHGRVVVTRHGRPAAVLMSLEDLESLEETASILSDAALLDDIREAERDLADGRTERLTKDQALDLISERDSA
jgi:prevent-host-death family protein